MSELLQDYERPAGRPVFLTVLCILTFVGSGWGLFGGIIQYFSAEKQAQMMELNRTKMDKDLEKSGNNQDSKVAKMVNSMTSAFTADNLKKAGIAAVLGGLFCLGGALMMWKLKKTGFYLYIVGTLIGIVSPFVIYGSGNLMSILTSVIVGFIGIVFVILYGLNVKYMK